MQNMSVDKTIQLRALAIYLPQFHPIKENDLWWGKGFTEWRNVTKAKPLFKGHYQPHLPADMGFYDLRLVDTMIEQTELAREYSIHGFMFYHYWFNGKLVLHTPIENYRYKIKNNFPYCFCWANENWTRRWDGGEHDILLRQDYSAEDDLQHIRFLLDYFSDPRYIKVDGKPVFAVYATNYLPNPLQTAEIWQNEAIKAGYKGLYLIRVESFDWNTRPAQVGFDAAMQFHPDWRKLKNALIYPSLPLKYANKYHNSVLGKFFRKMVRPQQLLESRIVDYQKYSEQFYEAETLDYKRYPCIMPSWDNSSRRPKGNATIFHNASPDLYKKWLSNIVKNFRPFSEDENFIFLNAWNEWAEGNHLEPCLKWGRQYLEATRSVLNGV
jgi:lipopolysaccharide biosynthesis protein